MEEFRLKDDKTLREVVVVGDLIGRAESDNHLRWTEVWIIRAASGRWVTATWGRSVVFHRDDGRCANAAGQPYGRPATYADLEDWHEPCPVCRPEEDGVLTDPVRIETDRCRVEVCDRPEEVFRALADDDDDGAPGRTYSRVAYKALRRARQADPRLVETVLVT